MGRIERSLWPVIAVAMAMLGCKPPPPTTAAVIAHEPNLLFWGETQLPGAELAESQLEPALDFVVVAGRVDSEMGDAAKKVWLETIESADAQNETCVFTSFIGWESSSTPDGLNRVVFMNEGAEQAGEFNPFGGADSASFKDPQAWLEETSHRVGTDFVTIPYDDGAIAATDLPEGLAPSESHEVSFGGLVAAWAEENTRTSIFAAFKSREVYATTGPRIRARFFGGWAFDGKSAKGPAMVATGYTLGHPMGSQLGKAPENKAPGFVMYAVKDPKGANLDRIQIVKRWVNSGGTVQQKVYDAVLPTEPKKKKKKKKKGSAATDSLEPGASALSGFWSDPEFDPKVPAFYYMRAVQISTENGAVQDGSDANATEPSSRVRQGAITSPIRYSPQLEKPAEH